MADNQIIEKTLKMLALVYVKVLDHFVVAGGDEIDIPEKLL